jgi:Uncharacterised protein conserved in bacteria (DUF2326)
LPCALVLDDGRGTRLVTTGAHLLDTVAQATDCDDLQYIATMNSDIFDSLPLPDEIDREKVTLKTRLSDENETGGLFGFRAVSVLTLVKLRAFNDSALTDTLP